MFKKIKKIFFINIFIYFSFSFSFAKYDCDLSLKNVDDYRLDNISDVYPKENIKTALDNLKHYCCEKNILSVDFCPKKDNNWQFLQKRYYSQSFWLMDHLVDVWFRYLDWDTLTQYDDASLESNWTKRREFIRNHAKSINWVSPNLIIENYNVFWNSENKQIPVHNMDQIKMNWQNWWLGNKYIATCNIAWYIQDVFLDKDNSRENSDVKKCKEFAWQVLKNEFNYVQYVMIQQWASFIVSNLRSYTSEYFVNSKLREMLENFAKMQATFLMVNQKVQEWTSVCTQ